MSNCLVGVTMAKNEADIIEANVRHNLRYLDRLIVLDHDSCDSTPRILQALVAEGLPLTVSRMSAPDPSFKQAQFTTALARGAFDKYAADYVIPIDADEFLRLPSREAFEAALHDATGPVTSLRWQTYVPAEGAQDHPVHALRWRVETEKDPLTKVVISRRILEKNWRIGRGNHVVFDQEGANLNWTAGEPLPGMSLAHLPLRSPQQLKAKALVGWLARKMSYGLNAETTTNSWHLREMYRRIIAGDAITPADVRNYAIKVYALGAPPDGAGAERFSVVEDQVAEPPFLRYTEEEAIDPARLLAVWSAQLIDNVLQHAGERPSTAEPAPP
jgi:hypothetical protein